MTEFRRHLSSPPAGAVLNVEDLRVGYGGRDRAPTVHDVSFELMEGQTLSIVGESGSGKTTVANAVLNLLPPRSWAAGSIRYRGEDILGIPERRFRSLRGRAIGYVAQDPFASLTPVRRIDSHLYEAFRHSGLPEHADRSGFRDRAEALLDAVGLRDPSRILHSYPHELSGGQLQRVVIGIVIAQRPSLIVADEPTSALDVTIQKRILDLFQELQLTSRLAILFITHDLSVANERSEQVLVLKDGIVQEAGSPQRVLGRPSSAYAKRLIADAPALNPRKFDHLKSVPANAASGPAALEVRSVRKTFGAGPSSTRALDEVDLTLRSSTTHAVVGESGSGKSTLARAILGLEAVDSGEILISGRRLDDVRRGEDRPLSARVQLVYQGAAGSLDPTYTVHDLVAEPLRVHGREPKRIRSERVRSAVEQVGLSADLLRRRSGELSGGQRQRVAIARALILQPDILVLDEPTSALDVTIQARIIEVLVELQRELRLSYLFISHDLSIVRQLAHDVTVLHHGRVVEHGSVGDVFENPRASYTRTLLESIPGTARPPRTQQASVSRGPAAEPCSPVRVLCEEWSRGHVVR